jgi:hypothetical protein
VDWLLIVFGIVLVVVCTLPLFFRLDPVNLGLSIGLGAVCLFLPLLLPHPLAMGLALGPVAIYLLLLGAINLARRPFLVSGARDTAALALAAAGLVVVGPMQLFFPLIASLRMGGYVWLLLLSLYGLLVVLLLLLFRPRLVIYNISTDELRPILADVVTSLDRDARWAGDSLAMPNLGVQLHLETVATIRNVSLISNGPEQSQQGWIRLETALSAALSRVEVPRNFRAMSLVSGGLVLLLFLAMAVARDPQAVAQAISQALAGALRG